MASSAIIPETPPTIALLAQLFDGELSAANYGANRGGVLITSERPVCKLGFALEADEGLGAWAHNEKIDALFLHRHWRLNPQHLPAGVGVVAYHEPYDGSLTTGPNAPLARELGMQNVVHLGEKDGAPVGMAGDVRPLAFEMMSIRVHHVFGEMDGILAPPGDDRLMSRIAVMSAMSDELVRLAAADRVDVYITGQYRIAAAKAVQETGLGVIAVGHERSEKWGLHVLARLAELAFPGLETAIYRKATSLGNEVMRRGQ